MLKIEHDLKKLAYERNKKMFEESGGKIMFSCSSTDVTNVFKNTKGESV